MNRNKCNRCGLINSASDENCRRCKTNLYSAENAPPRYAPAPLMTEAGSPPQSSFSFAGLIIIFLVLAAAGYYFYWDYTQGSLAEIEREKKQQEADFNRQQRYVREERENEQKKFIPPRTDGL
jgi:hypothetical protein